MPCRRTASSRRRCRSGREDASAADPAGSRRRKAELEKAGYAWSTDRLHYPAGGTREATTSSATRPVRRIRDRSGWASRAEARLQPSSCSGRWPRILFLMFRLMPGDPDAELHRDTLTDEQQQQHAGAVRPGPAAARPVPRLSRATSLQGELGSSFLHGRPVLDMVLEVLPNTLVLTLTGAGRRLCLRRGRRRLPRLEARHVAGGRRDPAGAGHARRAGILARHGAAGDLRLRARLVPLRRRGERGRSYEGDLARSPRARLPAPPVAAGVRRWRSICRACRCC